MKTKTIQVYADPGHAWAKVTYRELIDLGIDLKISDCSYVRFPAESSKSSITVFLEEDCDLSTYVEAQRLRGVKIAFKMHYANKRSRIRDYCSYASLKRASIEIDAVVRKLVDGGRLQIVKMGGENEGN